MSELMKLRPFLESVTYGDKKCSCLDKKNGQSPFITISRQAGAGGNSLAAAILEQLDQRKTELCQGWQKFNQELCHKIADEPGMSVALDRLVKLEYRSGIEDMVGEIMIGTKPQDSVNKKIFEWVRALAVHGKAILIGRGGVCYTRDLPLGIHIRLVAPLVLRVKRMSTLLELEEKKAKELVLEQDESRAKLMKNYFGKNIDDPLLYDAVWNTGTVAMEQIARSIVMMIEKKACLCKREHLLHEQSSLNKV